MTAHAAFGLSIEDLDIAVVEDSRNMQALICSMLAADFIYDLLVLHDRYATGNLVDAGVAAVGATLGYLLRGRT